jgi:hypothetical protein
MEIKIENLTKAQEIAIENLLANWQFMGKAGVSRWTCFYADGDGNFRPKITIDGKSPEISKIVNDEDFWQGNEYRIDFDKIAWALRSRETES